MTVDLEPDIETNRSERRLVAHAAPDRIPQVAEIQVAHRPEHVPRVDESDRAEAAGDRRPQLGIEDDQAVAANRHAVLVERLAGNADAVESEAANRRIAAGKEALARRQLLVARESGRETEPRAAGKHQPAGAPDRAVDLR